MGRHPRRVEGLLWRLCFARELLLHRRVAGFWQYTTRCSRRRVLLKAGGLTPWSFPFSSAHCIVLVVRWVVCAGSDSESLREEVIEVNPATDRSHLAAVILFVRVDSEPEENLPSWNEGHRRNEGYPR
jgi:hypothetical protein